MINKVNIFSSIALLLICLGLFMGYNDAPGTMTAAVISGLGFLFFAHLDQLSEFKASATGIEAKTRKLDETVIEAKSTINHLRSLARIMGKITLSQAIRTGRWGGYDDEELEKLKGTVHSVFDDLGLTEKDKKDATEEIERFTRYDYVTCITGPSSVAYVPNHMVGELREFRLLPKGAERSADEVKAFLEKAGQVSPEIDELIKDYDYYIRHSKHRRPEVFKTRRNWGELYLQKKL